MPLCCGPLKVEEISRASEEIIKLVQRDSGLDFIDKQMPNRTAKLSPIVDKGVVRVGGRLDNASLDGELKHPLLLFYLIDLPCLNKNKVQVQVQAILPADHRVRNLLCATFTSGKAMPEQIKSLLPSVNTTG